MADWKRDFASGLVILLPILVSAYIVVWLYRRLAGLVPANIVQASLFVELGLSAGNAQILAQLSRVLLSLVAFVALVFAVGYLMRTAAGDILERTLDDLANSVPGIRVVYNASKMAAETALSGTDELQAPVKLETWDGARMTAFKTGKSTADGRDVLFLPTAPNITTGFVIEVAPEKYEETDERVEEALTRVLSAGFGDTQTDDEVPIDVLTEDDEE